MDLNEYIRTINNIEILSQEEQLEMLEKYKKIVSEEEKFEIRTKIIESNLLYIVKCANRISKNEQTIFELIQEGSLGMLTAIERFDGSKGFSFLTYATYWINQAMLRYIKKNLDEFYIPFGITDSLRKLKLENRDRLERGMQTLSKEEVMDLIGVSEQIAQALIRLLGTIQIRIDKTKDDEDEVTASFEEIIGDARVNVLREVTISTEIEYFKDIMKEKLTERNYWIMAKRFGLEDRTEEMTLEEIGNELGLTRERVRQIIEDAINKLRLEDKKRNVICEYNLKKIK